MKRNKWSMFFFWAVLATAPLLHADHSAQTSVSDDTNVTRMVGKPIQNGFVLINGRYLSPPYRLSRTDKTVLINDIPLPTPFRKHFRPRTNRPHRDSSDRRRNASAHPIDAEGVLEKCLLGDSMIITVEPDFILVVPSFLASELISILESEASTEEKLKQLENFQNWNIPSSCWLRLMELYAPNPELQAAVADLTVERINTPTSLPSAPTYRRTIWLQTTPILSTAMLVIAFGVLIRVGVHAVRTPEEYRQWRNIDNTGLRANLVLQMLLLLALLNLFDLLFTITAHQTGGFTEANPIGRILMDNPLALSIFKLVLVGIGVSLLFMFRNRRVKELATWWICMVYTIILVRWAVVNSHLAY